MFIGLVLVAALASVVESPSPDALARPKVESRGAFVCRGGELSLTAARPASSIVFRSRSRTRTLPAH